MIGKKVRRRLFIVIVMISVLAQLVSAQGSLLANEIVSAHADEWWLDDEKEPLPTIVYDDLTDQEKQLTTIPYNLLESKILLVSPMSRISTLEGILF